MPGSGLSLDAPQPYVTGGPWIIPSVRYPQRSYVRVEIRPVLTDLESPNPPSLRHLFKKPVLFRAQGGPSPGSVH